MSQSIKKLKVERQKKSIRLSLVLFFIFFFLILNNDTSNLIDKLDRQIYDIKMRLLGNVKPTPSPHNIVILSLDERDTKSGLRMAQLLDSLMQQGVSLTAFDFIINDAQKSRLIRKTKGEYISEQQLLASKIAEHDSVLGFRFLSQAPTEIGQLVVNYFIHLDKNKRLSLKEETGYIANTATLQTAAQGSGFFDLQPDSDGILRKASLLKSYQEQLFPSFALALSMTYLVHSGVNVDTRTLGQDTYAKQITLANRKLITDSQARVFIPFTGTEKQTYPIISSNALFSQAEDILAGSIVIMSKAKNLSKQFNSPTGYAINQTQIQATLIDALLSGHFLYEPTFIKLAKLITLIALAIALSLLMANLSSLSIGMSALSVIVILYAVEVGLFLQHIQFGMSLPCVFVLAMALGQGLIRKDIQKQKDLHYQLKFSQSLPPKQIHALNKNNWMQTQAQYKPLGLLRMAYTPWSGFISKHSAAEQQRLQKEFLTTLTNELIAYSGALANYNHDGLSAYWGAPIECKQHSNIAVACALGMKRALQQFLETQETNLLPEQGLQIGLHESTCLVGDFGSQQYHSYRIKGEGLNINWNISRLNQQYDTQILASESIYLGASDYVFRYIDTVYLPSHQATQALRLYEPICTRKEQTPKLKKELKDYEHALNQYMRQKWYSAGIAFDKLMEAYPDQHLYKLYRKRVRELATQDVPEHWRGEYPLIEHTNLNEY